MLGNCLISHWSKVQSNVPLRSGEAQVNAAVKGVSELIGMIELHRELQDENIFSHVFQEATACKGMLLKNGAEEVKHLTTKQLWSHGALADATVVKNSRKHHVIGYGDAY